MTKEIWTEILVGVILAGGLLFLGKNDMEMQGVLGRVEGKVDNTPQRVERIAEAVPDVGVRIADEEIRRPIRGAVITGLVHRSTSAGWIAEIEVIDTQKALKWVLPVALSSRTDRRAMYALL